MLYISLYIVPLSAALSRTVLPSKPPAKPFNLLVVGSIPAGLTSILSAT